MGSFSIWHWLIVLLVVALLFGGGGKMSRMLGDLGRGLRVFQKNLKGDSDAERSSTDDDEDNISKQESQKLSNSSGSKVNPTKRAKAKAKR